MTTADKNTISNNDRAKQQLDPAINSILNETLIASEVQDRYDDPENIQIEHVIPKLENSHKCE